MTIIVLAIGGMFVFFVGYMLGLKHGRTQEAELLEKIADRLRDEVESAVQRASGVRLH